MAVHDPRDFGSFQLICEATHAFARSTCSCICSHSQGPPTQTPIEQRRLLIAFAVFPLNSGSFFWTKLWHVSQITDAFWYFQVNPSEISSAPSPSLSRLIDYHAEGKKLISRLLNFASPERNSGLFRSLCSFSVSKKAPNPPRSVSTFASVFRC